VVIHVEARLEEEGRDEDEEQKMRIHSSYRRGTDVESSTNVVILHDMAPHEADNEDDDRERKSQKAA